MGTFLRRCILRALEQVRDVLAPLLITGETGTGKEVLARAVHEKLRLGEFVHFDCAGLPEPLFESELFGYKKGSFTGAYSDKRGLVELADGGTLFLDEIGDLPLHVQSKLLRVLQDGRFRRIGEVKERKSSFFLIAATNADLRSLVEAGKFRKDLYFRLKGRRVHLPPLRETPGDILPLLVGFLGEMEKRPEITTETLGILLSYSWPGNVRELRHFASILPGEGELNSRNFPYDFLEGGGRYGDSRGHLTLKKRLEAIEKSMIEDMLRKGATIKEISRELEKSEVQTRRILKKLGIDLKAYRKR